MPLGKRKIEQTLFFSLRQYKKSWEFDKDLFIAFTEYEKGFDSITQNKIWECLNRLEINSDLIERIKQTYERTTICVKTNIFEQLKTESGVQKSSILSPTLFYIKMSENIFRKKSIGI